MIQNDKIDARYYKSVQVLGEVVCAFNDVVKYSNLESSDSVEKTVIGEYNLDIANHSVANLGAEKLFITGGVKG